MRIWLTELIHETWQSFAHNSYSSSVDVAKKQRDSSKPREQQLTAYEGSADELLEEPGRPVWCIGLNPSGCVDEVVLEHHEHVLEEIVFQQSLHTSLHMQVTLPMIVIANDEKCVMLV